MEGPYLGQLEAVLHKQAPDVPVFNLVSNAPRGDPRLSAYLLAALAQQFPSGSVFLCVVDPGVGGSRLPVVLEADGRWLVGPDNGLFNTVAMQAMDARWRIIDWRPQRSSNTFHGRDLFAPIAAQIATGSFTWAYSPWVGPALDAWLADLFEIVYFDHYGNALTGLRYRPEFEGRQLIVGSRCISQVSSFCEAPEGNALWYRNSMDLVEVAINRGDAQQVLQLKLSDPLTWVEF